MVARLGIVVSERELRGVLVRRNRVEWAGERLLEGNEDLAGALGELVAQGPAGVRRVNIALDGSLCQVKIIDVPRLKGQALSRVVELNATRWFLRNGHPLVTCATHHGTTSLAAATDTDTLERIANGAAQAGFTSTRVTVTADVMASLQGEGTCRWESPAATEGVTARNGWPVELRRAAFASDPMPRAPGSEDAMGLPSPAFRPAFASATQRPRLIFRVPSALEASSRRRMQLGRRLLTIGALLTVAAPLTLGARLEHERTREQHRLTSLRDAAQSAEGVRTDLDRATAFLGVLDRARYSRSSDRDLIATLTAVISDSGYVVALRRDGADTVVISGVASSASTVLRGLRAAPTLRGAAFEGPVTTEASGGRVLQRFMIRFVWSPRSHVP